MSSRSPTLAGLLVRGMRSAAARPADARRTRWTDAADRARDLAVGLIDDDQVAGRTVTIDLDALHPVEAVICEVAVWAAGGAVRLSGVGRGQVLGRRSGRSDRVDCDLDVDALVAAGRVTDASPDDHEERLAALDPDAIAVVGDGVALTHGQLAWALRSVQQWLREVVPDGPSVVAVSAGRTDVAGVMLTRWWPAVEGARTVPVRPGTLPAVVDEVDPDVVLAGPDEWHAVAARLREVVPSVRFGTAMLRAGRIAAAGEPAPLPVAGWAEASRRWVGPRVRTVANMGSMRAGVCLGVPRAVDSRDLDAVGLAVVPTWLERPLAAPVAAGVTGSGGVGGWGRPLPGRTVDVGPPATVAGGDVAAPVRVSPTRAAGHRVKLPRVSG